MGNDTIFQERVQEKNQLTVAIFLYDSIGAIEAIAPYETLRLLPNVIVKFVAERKGAVRCDSRMISLLADYTIDEVSYADILIIPGGNVKGVIENEHVLSWIRNTYATSLYTAAVCVGSVLLGAAGLLQGVHAARIEGVELPSFEEIRVPERVVADGKIITGTSAATAFDLGIYLVAQIAGADAARGVQIGLEYDVESWKQPFIPRPIVEAELEGKQKFQELLAANPQVRAVISEINSTN